MKKSLFVAGLDYAITDDELKEVFAEHGAVESVKVVTDRYTGRSRGFAFVDMSSQTEAEACINALNNTTLKGRQIVVRLKEDKPAGGNGGNKRRAPSRGGW